MKGFVKQQGLILLALLLLQSMVCQAGTRVITMGLLLDGPMERSDDLLSLFSTEIEAVTAGDCVVRFPESRQCNGQWTLSGITDGLRKLENDPGVDMILVVGVAAGRIAAEKDRLKKPTFVPFLFDPGRGACAGSQGRPGSGNLNCLIAEWQFEENLKTFLEVVHFSRLGLVVDELYSRAFPEVLEHLRQSAAAHGVSLEIIPVSLPDEAVMDRIPAAIEAVMITPLPRLTRAAGQALIDGLIRQRIPGYSLSHWVPAEDGILISSVPESDLSRRARMTALNIQAVLKGGRPDAQPMMVEQERRLVINMATARAIGVYPNFRILDTALVLNPDVRPRGPALSLESVAREAISANLDIIAGKLGVQSGQETVAEARSILFPQVTGAMGYVRNNSDSPYVKIGYIAEKSTAGSIQLEQVLFSERALAKLDIEKKLHAAREAQQQSLELDIVEQAAAGFLSILMAQTQLRIVQDNLTLTKSNLELSRNRVSVGQSDASDLYRWESEIATVKQNVLKSRTSVDKAWDALNRILHRPMDHRFVTLPATLEDPALLVSRKELLSLISDERAYGRMADFFIDQGLASSPDLARLNAFIAAKSRENKSDCRAFWSPEVVLFGEVTRVVEETREPLSGISLEDQTNWETGVRISLPLFDGGARTARKSRSALALQQLEVTFQNSREVIQQCIRSDLHDIRASYPSINLSAMAAVSARKSFNLMRENYIQGTRTLTDLLVSQNAKLTAEQSAANAVFRFLKDLISLQRDIGEFDFFLDDPRRDAVIQRLTDVISNGPLPRENTPGP